MQPSPVRPVAGADLPPAGLADRARRFGPLPCSALGIAPPPVDLPPPAVLARWEAETADRLWRQAGRPDPFTVVEVASGDGSTASELLGAARPECAPALRLVLVESDPNLAALQAGRLPVEHPALLLGPVTAGEEPDDEPQTPAGIGPLVTSLTEPPVVHGWCAVLAAGWLSRLPCDVFEWLGGAWHEVRLAAGDGPELEPVVVEVDGDRRRFLDALVPEGRRHEGERFAAHVGAAEWVRDAMGGVETGWLVAADMWVERTSSLPDGPASPVALDQIAAVRRPESGIEDGPGRMGAVRWRIG